MGSVFGVLPVFRNFPERIFSQSLKGLPDLTDWQRNFVFLSKV